MCLWHGLNPIRLQSGSHTRFSILGSWISHIPSPISHLDSRWFSPRSPTAAIDESRVPSHRTRISSQIYAKLWISNLVSPGLLIAWAPERLMKILKNCTAIISPALRRMNGFWFVHILRWQLTCVQPVSKHSIQS